MIIPIEVTTAMLTSSTILEDDAAEWDAVTSFAVDDLVILASTHRIYRAILGGGANVNKNPATETTYWLDSGATMKWRMFDEVVGAQSADVDGLAVSIQLDSDTLITSVAALNCIASSIRIVVTDPVDGVVYDETTALISDSGIVDWYAWFNTPLKLTADFAVTDIPAYVGALVEITFAGSGIVSCGELVLGTVEDMGGTEYGATVSIRDYSVKTQDDFGFFSITPRAYSKRGQFKLQVEAAEVDDLAALLAEYRSTPVVYVGTDDYASTIVYGFFKNFDIDIAYANLSYCSIEIEGLT